MKKTIIILSAIFVVGVSGAFIISKLTKHDKECCKTEVCRQHCIESKCCIKGKTCDITDGKECKHKCCDIESSNCEITSEKSCCKK